MSNHRKVVSIIGCGWLGLPLAKKLVALGFKVKGSTTRESRLSELTSNEITAYRLQLSASQRPVFSDLLECRTLIINIPPGRRDVEAISHYPKGIKTILEGIGKSLIDHIIYTSSTGVYQNTGHVVTEESPCFAARPGIGAIMKAEDVIVTSGFNYTIVRLAGLVGENRQPGKWFQGREGLPGGDTPVNMIHLGDCISALLELVKSEPDNEIYNLCADRHPTKKEFYRRQSEKLKLTPPRFEAGVVAHKIVDNSKFKDAFGYEYQYPDPLNF